MSQVYTSTCPPQPMQAQDADDGSRCQRHGAAARRGGHAWPHTRAGRRPGCRRRPDARAGNLNPQADVGARPAQHVTNVRQHGGAV